MYINPCYGDTAAARLLQANAVGDSNKKTSMHQLMLLDTSTRGRLQAHAVGHSNNRSWTDYSRIFTELNPFLDPKSSQSTYPDRFNTFFQQFAWSERWKQSPAASFYVMQIWSNKYFQSSGIMFLLDDQSLIRLLRGSLKMSCKLFERVCKEP